jgi:hypothetical protein
LRPASRTPADAFIARFLARVPVEQRASFTPAQLTAVRQAFGMRYSMEHTLDVRRYVGLPWARYYLVVLWGRDHRPRERSFRGPAVTLAALAAGIVLMFTL